MGLRHVENGLIALLPGSARIMLGLADSNEPSQVSLQDALWRRPIALFATAALRRTLGQVTRPKDVGRILRTFKIKKNVEVTDNGKIII